MARDKGERRHRRTWRHPACVEMMANANFDAVPSLSEAMGLVDTGEGARMGTQTIKGLAIGDLAVSLLHGQMVRIAGVEPDGFVRVADKDTGRELADLVNPQQIQTPAEHWNLKRAAS